MESQKQIEECLEFIQNKIERSYGECCTHNSYSLKHFCEDYLYEVGKPTYISNENFKKAMEKCGYLPMFMSPFSHNYQIKLK